MNTFSYAYMCSHNFFLIPIVTTDLADSGVGQSMLGFGRVSGLSSLCIYTVQLGNGPQSLAMSSYSEN